MFKKILLWTFAAFGALMLVLILWVCLFTSSNPEPEPLTEIKFDVYVPNRTDTLHRVITTTRGNGHVLRYDKWTYIIQSESGRTIWKESYPIKITEQKKIR